MPVLIPAVYVSSVNPVKVFKASSNIRLLKRVTFRKVLLVAQYTFSIIFIISIILLYRQMSFMLKSELGFDKEVVYNIRLNGQQFSKVKDQFSQLPEVTSISAGSHVPGIGNHLEYGILKSSLRMNRTMLPIFQLIQITSARWG